MRPLCKLLLLLVIALPKASQAGIIPVISTALALIRAIPAAAPPIGNAAASIGLVGNPAIGALARGFGGAGSASANVDIDRFRETSATADASWLYEFRIAQPGLTTIRLNYSYGGSTSVFTNFNANSRANVSISNLTATLTVGALVQSLNWGDLNIGGNCSSSGLFDDCGPSPSAQARSFDQMFEYSSGYPVGTLIDITGTLHADSFGHTGIGSAESAAAAYANFAVTAVPLPSTLLLMLSGLPLALCRRRPDSPTARRSKHGA